VYGKGAAIESTRKQGTNFTSKGASGQFRGDWKKPSAQITSPRRAAFSTNQRALISLLACPQIWFNLSEQQRSWLREGAERDNASKILLLWFESLDDASTALAMAEHAELPNECERLLDQARLEAAETSPQDALLAIAKLEVQAIKEELQALVEGRLVSKDEQASYRALQERLKVLLTPSASDQTF
jgi:hypothetical protein